MTGALKLLFLAICMCLSPQSECVKKPPQAQVGLQTAFTMLICTVGCCRCRRYCLCHCCCCCCCCCWIHSEICCQLIWCCDYQYRCVSEGCMSARAYSRTRKQSVEYAHGVASLPDKELQELSPPVTFTLCMMDALCERFLQASHCSLCYTIVAF